MLLAISSRRCSTARCARKRSWRRRNRAPSPPSATWWPAALRATREPTARVTCPCRRSWEVAPSPSLGGRDTVSAYARTDLAQLLLAAPPPALRGLGQCREAAAPPRARRARSLPELGLDGGGSPGRLAHHRAGFARPRGQPVVARRQLHHGGLHLRPCAADPSAAPRPRH